ncbi:MAG: NADPH:quinone oxidoreductase family protein [Pseudomonadales bacterium]
MKAVYCERLGTPDDLVVREIEPPGPPGPTELKVWLKARGVAFTDVLMVAGEYQVKPKLPFIVGGEGAGVVTEVGGSVRGFSVGDRVLCPGGCVEQVLVDQSRATRLPDSVAFEPAAAFRANYATGLYGLQRARLKKGETLLVHGAAGGVGLAAVDLGKHLGATVIATASTPEKRRVALEMGADHAIDYTGGFRDQVKALTGDRGADVIYDPVGGNVFDESMRCIAPFGRILIVGFTSGRPALAKTNHLLIKDAELIGFTIGALSRHDPAWAARNAAELMSLLAAGSIRPYISHHLPLEETAKALNLIRARRVIGKAIITSY